jgi:pimeloyl-ACP methyl ester carboxylesterase
MPIIKAGPYDIDYIEAGSGPAVLLLHSSAAGNRQWRKLMEERAGKNRLFAVNLFGYGATSAWPGERPMQFDDQANLVMAVAHFLPERFTLVGHSLGAAVAMQAAGRLKGRLDSLVLFEPILFYLLSKHGEQEAFAEIDALRRACLEAGRKRRSGDSGENFHRILVGARRMGRHRRRTKGTPAPDNPRTDSRMGDGHTDGPPLDSWKSIEAPVHVLSAADTRRPTRAIAGIRNAQRRPHIRIGIFSGSRGRRPHRPDHARSRPDLVNRSANR